ncbi:DMT family transporter [Candidatus Micrarchaeota archaeon]|nr:DMT family transporter [Candidatus Micrarchaeota archaeon]
MIPELTFGLAAALFWGLGDFFGKRALQKISFRSVAFYTHLFLAAFFAVALFSSAEVVLSSYDPPVLALFTGLLWAAGSYFFFKALESGALSIVVPVNASDALLVVILSVFLLGESISFFQGLLVFFIILGVVLVSTKYSHFKKFGAHAKPVQGAIHSLFSAGAYGVALFLLKPLSQQIGTLGALFLIYSFSLIPLFFWFRNEKGVDMTGTPFKLVVLSSFLYGLANFSYVSGVRMHLASLVMPVAATFPLVAVALGYFFFRERLEFNQWLGILIVVAGTALLAVG